MNGGHQHAGGHRHGPGVRTPAGGHRRRLAAVLGITATVLVAEVIGGLLAGSLALLADAGHALADGGGIALALVAATLAQRPPTARRTFGWQRLEILAAAANALLLCGIAVGVLVEAVRRLVGSPHVSAGPMLAAALLALAGNVISLRLLHAGRSGSLLVRGAYLEVLGDLAGAAAVVVAATVVGLTGWTRADAVASAGVGLLILPRAWTVLAEAVDVLLEATPKNVDLPQVRRHLLDVPGVLDVHDLHVWTITSGMPALAAHVVVDESAPAGGCGGLVLDRLTECLTGHFDVAHSTFQLEPITHSHHEHPPC